jgi:hypothetical protein
MSRVAGLLGAGMPLLSDSEADPCVVVCSMLGEVTYLKAVQQ